jgi:hypothetical protein
MRDDAIPDDVRRFILTAVPSAPRLEALLQFLHDTSQRHA